MSSNVITSAPDAHDGLPRGPVSAKQQNFHFIQSRAVPVKLRLASSVQWSYFPDAHAAAVFFTDKKFFSSVHTAEASLNKTLKTENKRSDGLVVGKCTVQNVMDHGACEYLEYKEKKPPHRTFRHASWTSAFHDSEMCLDSHYSSPQNLSKAVMKKLNGDNVPGLSQYEIKHIARSTESTSGTWLQHQITYDAAYRIREQPTGPETSSQPTKPRQPCSHKCRDKNSCLHACCKVTAVVNPPAEATAVGPNSTEREAPLVTTTNSIRHHTNTETRRPCKHTRRDKTKCLHSCCKIGVLVSKDELMELAFRTASNGSTGYTYELYPCPLDRCPPRYDDYHMHEHGKSHTRTCNRN